MLSASSAVQKYIDARGLSGDVTSIIQADLQTFVKAIFDEMRENGEVHVAVGSGSSAGNYIGEINDE